jgi:Holliday junction resolvase RusA-like endonuclease
MEILAVNKLEFRYKNTRPSSTNRRKDVNYKTKKLYNNSEYKNAKKKVALMTMVQSRDIAKFESEFDIHAHAVSAVVVWDNPKLVTKKGYVSKTSGDIDNGLKCLLDSIFSCFQKLDDSIVCDLRIIKRLSPDNNHHLRVKLEKISLEDLC